MIKSFAIFIITLAACMSARNWLIAQFVKWAGKTETVIDDVIIGAVKSPSILWCIMIAVYATLNWSALPSNDIKIFGKVLLVLGVFSITIVVSNILVDTVRASTEKSGTASYIPSFTYIVLRIVVYTLGVLVILNGLGISIAPILATLGVGCIAVALALQDTLSNLFAGFYILLARQIKVGDYIRLESGEEGYVSDMN